MIKKVSLRWRVTILSSLLITVCCIGLSIVLNMSAYHMADRIDASVAQPAQMIDGTGENAPPIIPFESASAVKLAKNDYFMKSIIYTVVAVFTGGMLTYSILGKALEPVRALNEQVKKVNTHNLNESLEIPPTKDELAELTASFNDMTNKLSQAFEMQKRFSADAAHELRTPLAVLQTKLDVFRKKEEHSVKEYETVMNAVQKQVKRLRNLVTELLDIANMEHEFHKQDILIGALLKDVITELNPFAKEKNITLILNSSEYHVYGDYNLLYRAFFNLTENAIKYNVKHGKVILDVFKTENDMIFMIKDTGIGIPDDMKKQIFEPFYRVDKSRSREMGGAGLGLVLTETIIKNHNGTICVTDCEGGGSCFTITLPIT